MKITTRQICIFFITIFPLSKLMLYPSTVSKIAENDLVLAFFINLAIDVLLFLCIASIMRKSEGQTFFQLLESTFGKTTSRIIMAVYALYFFCKAYVPIIEQKNFIEITFYETSPTVLTFLPFFLVSFYGCFKGIKGNARAAEALVWISGAALIILLVLAIGECDMTRLLPIGRSPLKQTLFGSWVSVIWFSDSLYLLFFMGKFNVRKGDLKRIFAAFSVGALIVALYLAVFYGVFGPIAEKQLFAAAKMSKYSVALFNVGRFDYIAIIMLATASVVTMIIPLMLCCECITEAFHIKNAVIPAAVVNAVVFTLVTVFNLYLKTILELTITYLVPFYIICAYVLPFTLFVIVSAKRRNNSEVAQNKPKRNILPDVQAKEADSEVH